MSSTPNPQPPRPRPGTKTKAQHELPTSPVPIPAQEKKSEHCRPHSASQRPKTTHGKKDPSPRTSAPCQDTPHGSSSRHNDLSSVGAWCDDIPQGHYTRRMSLDGDARAQLPRAPTPPSPPYIPRLDSPDPSFLAYDTEFRVIGTGEEDERVGNAWYIARQAKTSRQCFQSPFSLVPSALIRQRNQQNKAPRGANPTLTPGSPIPGVETPTPISLHNPPQRPSFPAPKDADTHGNLPNRAGEAYRSPESSSSPPLPLA